MVSLLPTCLSNSLVKSFESGVFFVRKVLIMNSISLTDIGLLRFPVDSYGCFLLHPSSFACCVFIIIQVKLVSHLPCDLVFDYLDAYCLISKYRYFLTISLLPVSTIIPLWSENILPVILVDLNVLTHVLWPNLLSCWAFHSDGKYSALGECSVYKY